MNTPPPHPPLPPRQSPSGSVPSLGNRSAFSFGKLLNLAGPAIALVLIFLFFVALVPDWTEHRTLAYQLTGFANFENISNILRQSCMTAVASLGMTFIIIAGGIDLSAGSLAAFTGVIIAVILQSGEGPASNLHQHPFLWPLLAAVVGCTCAVGWGFLNGALITGLRIVPFIVTLGTMMIIRGNAKGFGHESNVPTLNNWLWSLMGNLNDNMTWLLFPQPYGSPSSWPCSCP